MALEESLLEVLACPDAHHAPLRYDPQASTLTCTVCSRVFDVREHIPVLLLEESDESATDEGGPQT